jgi:hypothetical protein
MKKNHSYLKTAVVIIAFTFVTGPLAAQTAAQPITLSPELEVFFNSMTFAQEQSVWNNEYFIGSLHLANLARLALLDEKFEESMEYSRQAKEQAILSDKYIARALALLHTDEIITEAEERLAWADDSGASRYYQEDVDNAKSYYDQAMKDRGNDDLERAEDNARLAIAALADVAAPPPIIAANPENIGPPPQTSDFKEQPQEPDTYRVRPWDQYGDCFWNIAAWFYGNPRYWPRLYEANKSSLPDPNNADLIEVGTLLVIPPMHGETRDGVWDTGKTFVR